MRGEKSERSAEANSVLRAISTDEGDMDRPPPMVVSTLGTQSIFHQLIVNEIRSGRLTPARRRRIIAYAARLGLTAIEVGEMIAACREQVLVGGDPVEQTHALRVVLPERRRVPTGIRMALIAVIAIVAELLFLHWRW